MRRTRSTSGITKHQPLRVHWASPNGAKGQLDTTEYQYRAIHRAFGNLLERQDTINLLDFARFKKPTAELVELLVKLLQEHGRIEFQAEPLAKPAAKLGT